MYMINTVLNPYSISKDKHIIRTWMTAKNTSEELINAINTYRDDIINTAKIGIIIGPGSFSNIRVGCCIVNSMRITHPHIQLYTASIVDIVRVLLDAYKVDMMLYECFRGQYIAISKSTVEVINSVLDNILVLSDVPCDVFIDAYYTCLKHTNSVSYAIPKYMFDAVR